MVSLQRLASTHPGVGELLRSIDGARNAFSFASWARATDSSM